MPGREAENTVDKDGILEESIVDLEQGFRPLRKLPLVKLEESVFRVADSTATSSDNQ